MSLSWLPNPSRAEKTVMIVPTRNPGDRWADFLHALQIQSVSPHQVIVLDSETDDKSMQAAESCGYTIHSIKCKEFSHGGTRQKGIDLYGQKAEFAVFLTQDAILADASALQNLLDAFDDPKVAAAYGRQLPHANANPISAHARLFNYPANSHTVTLADKAVKGLKTCFLSNSFAAYRLSALRQAGGFSSHLILGEDMHLSARLLIAGHAIRYEASANVFHTHNYTLQDEFKRYFDTGVFHAQQAWLCQTFGAAGNEGLKFVKSELRHLLETDPGLLPEALIRNLLKVLGFKWGQHYRYTPIALKRHLTMRKEYWS